MSKWRMPSPESASMMAFITEAANVLRQARTENHFADRIRASMEEER